MNIQEDTLARIQVLQEEVQTLRVQLKEKDSRIHILEQLLTEADRLLCEIATEKQ